MLKQYLKKINRDDLYGKNDKINFKYDSKDIKFGNKTPIGIFFEKDCRWRVAINIKRKRGTFLVKVPRFLLFGKMVNAHYLHCTTCVHFYGYFLVDRYVPKRYAQAGSLGSSVNLKYG